MTAKIHSLTAQGLQVTPVEIEVDVANGLPSFIIVGLPDAAVSEARDRVRSAIKNSGFQFPRTRVTVNLAPAHTKKAGSLYDLPIAIGILLASGQIQEVPEWYIIGELALDGRTHAVQGALPLLYDAAIRRGRTMVIPEANSQEAGLLSGAQLYTTGSLVDVVAALEGDTKRISVVAPTTIQEMHSDLEVDMKDVIGQPMAKRAIEIAAAGNHPILFSGPPGVGKSMLAKALPGILPPLSHDECVEVSMIHSLRSNERSNNVVQRNRPFRAPHHNISSTALLGGGVGLEPGEISLAHKGVLFLDELPEFRRDTIESLRQPIEDGTISIRRANGSVDYPARFLFIAAVNPCPCGYFGVREQYPEIHKECSCTPHQVARYQQKLSGPIMDRIDMHVTVSYIPSEQLRELQQDSNARECSTDIQKRVEHARLLQQQRQGVLNAELSPKDIQEHVSLDMESMALLKSAMSTQSLSMRGYHKTLQVARTIADISDEQHVSQQCIAEALQYVMRQHSE